MQLCHHQIHLRVHLQVPVSLDPKRSRRSPQPPICAKDDRRPRNRNPKGPQVHLTDQFACAAGVYGAPLPCAHPPKSVASQGQDVREKVTSMFSVLEKRLQTLAKAQMHIDSNATQCDKPRAVTFERIAHEILWPFKLCECPLFRNCDCQLCF